jgi:hypothetical protein
VGVKVPILLLFGLAILGCTNQVAQKANQKAPSTQGPVDSAAIAVIPNPYVDDLTIANKAAEDSKQELIKRGYQVVASEAEAKIIAVPTVETNVVTIAAHPSERPIDLLSSNTLDQLGRDSVTNSLGSLGGVSPGPGNSFGKGRDLLVIEAFPKDAWDHALIVNELQLQPVWKIRMPLPGDLKPSVDGEKVAHMADTDFQLPH